MNVGLSTPVIQRGRSGVAQYVFALVQALAEHRERFRLTLFVLAQDLPLFEFARDYASLVQIPEGYRPAVRNILWHQTVLPALAQAHRLDVLHVPSYRRMLWQRPCALVSTIHDLAPFRLPGKDHWMRMAYGRVVARRLAHRQHRIIGVSQNTVSDILRFFKVPAERVSAIHNGLDHSRFCPGPAEPAKQAVLEKFGLGAPFFLYVARLEHPGKNHVRLIEAFNRFKAESKCNWQLVFGGSDWHGAAAIHAAIAESPFRKDIVTLGFVKDEELPLLYRAASVFVYPSLFEGFGLPPLEAMACGCPVSCSTRGALGEVVGNAALTVDPEDISAMTNQLTALADGPALREQLRVAGLARAQRFNWQRTASNTVAVYRAAMVAARAPASGALDRKAIDI